MAVSAPPKCADLSVEELYRAIRQYNDGKAAPPDEALAGRFPQRLIMAKLRKLEQHNLVNYGVSLRCCWLIEDHPDWENDYDDGS